MLAIQLRSEWLPRKETMICEVTVSTVTKPRWSVVRPLFHVSGVYNRTESGLTYAKVARTLAPRAVTLGQVLLAQATVVPRGTSLLQYEAAAYWA